MKLREFTLDLGTVDQSAVGQAAFYALIATGWALYSAGLVAYSAKGVDLDALTDEDRKRYAETAFRYVVQWMPEGHPYRREVERYTVEALPEKIREVDARIPTLMPRLPF